jgi:hypothetical protein
MRKGKMTQPFNFIEDNQSSSGALILPDNSENDEDFRNSAGALIPLETPKSKEAPQDVTASHPAKDFRAMSETIEDLDPYVIQPIAIIPDYLEPTSSLNPIVVKAPAGCYCIEGWQMIQEAIGSGRSPITSHVFHVQEISENELAIRKAAMRMLPQGGKASYAEIMRNARILFNLLASSMENPIIYSHGGVRKGAAFPENREENIRLVLAERLGKSVTTISKYLNHAEYLTDEAISALVQAGEDKEFFEDTQIVKRKLLTNLKSSGTTEDEISTQVSEAMLRMHQNEAEIETYKKTLFYAPEEDKPAGQSPGTTTLATEPERPITFKHWGGAEESLPEQSVEGDDLRREITAIAQRMISSSEDPNMSLASLKESIMAHIGELLSLLQKIGEAEDSPRKEGE